MRRYKCDFPRQFNNTDCGVFALMPAECLSRGAPLAFSERDMPIFRKMIAADIMGLQVL